MDEHYQQHPVFTSYREYVGLCLEAGNEVPFLSEFTGSDTDAFKVEPEVVEEMKQ